jgi:hypothetical protein
MSGFRGSAGEVAVVEDLWSSIGEDGRDPRLGWFASGGKLDGARPSGRVLGVLECLAVGYGPEDRAFAGATWDEESGMLAAAEAAESHAAAVKLAAVRALIRRHAPAGPGGGLPDPGSWDIGLLHEIAAILRISWQAADSVTDLAWQLEARLPGVGEMLDVGVLTSLTVRIIAEEFAVLDGDKLAEAEKRLLDHDLAADEMTPGAIRRLCQRLADTVDPEGAARRREQAERDRARVRYFRSHGGAGALFADGLPPDAALKSEANVQKRAGEYKAAGITEKMDFLRVLALVDLTNGVSVPDRVALWRAGQAERQRAGEDDPGRHGWEQDQYEEENLRRFGDRPPFPDREPGDLDDRYPGGEPQPPDEPPAAGGPHGSGCEDGPDPDTPFPDREPDDLDDLDGWDDDLSPGPDDPSASGGTDDPGNTGGPGGTGSDRDDDHVGRDSNDSPDGKDTGGNGPGDSHGEGDGSADHDRGDGDDSPGTGDGSGGDGGPEDGDGPSGGSPGGDGGSGPGGGTGPGGAGTGPVPAGMPDPGLPTLANMTYPLATVLGQADRPGEAAGYGSLDPALVRTLANAAAKSPRSRFCVTFTDEEGHAAAHGCARLIRGKGSMRRNGQSGRGAGSPGGTRDGPAGTGWAFTRDPARPGPDGGYGAWVLTLPGGVRYRVEMHAVPLHDCDHRYATGAYRPGDLLRHLVEVRDGECTFPGCSRPARESDFEHAVPHHKGGKTDACNAGMRSRRCHRVKQSPGWHVTQPEPGWHQWQAPSGRTYTKGPKSYPA